MNRVMLNSIIPGAPNPNLSKGIRDEHCVMWGFDVELKTGNHGLTTTPKREYEISVGMQICPEVDMKDKEGIIVRVIRRIVELRQLQVCLKAGLSSRLTDDENLTVVRALLSLGFTKHVSNSPPSAEH